MRAVIIGGGIGGLAAAVALRRVGVESRILEKVDSIREIGAGLSLWSNAVNALRELGVAARVTDSASLIEHNSIRNLTGRLLAVTEFGEVSRQAGAPCICILRPVLQRILLEELPSAWIRTGARCVGFKDSTAVLEDGERIEADLLVGADGISSVIRAGLHGAEPPRYAGYTCWRGILTSNEALQDNAALPDNMALLAAGAGSEFGLWPCGAGQLYWFFTKNASQGTRRTKADVVALSRNWAAAIPNIIEATAESAIMQNDIFDRPPLRWWGRGRVTLLGDAAHPTTPNLGQGACMALEDAVVLAHCLSTIRPIESALLEYERLRIPRTSAIVRDSRRTGRILQLEQPALESVRDWFTGSSLGKYVGTLMFRKLLTYKVPRLPAPATR